MRWTSLKNHLKSLWGAACLNRLSGLWSCSLPRSSRSRMGVRPCWSSSKSRTHASSRWHPGKGNLSSAISWLPKTGPCSTFNKEIRLPPHQAWVIPGFISAHSHLWQGAYRGLAADKTLIGWIDDLYFQRAAKANPTDLYWFCLLGALDHLQGGITAVFDFDYARIYWKGSDNDFDMA